MKTNDHQGDASVAGPVLQRREAVLDALEMIFQKRGFREVTIGELAGRLQCSRRVFYEIASTKEGLFLLVLDRLLRRVRRLGDEALNLADPADRFARFLEPGFTQRPHAGTAFFADIDSLPAARRLLERHQRERVEGVRQILEDGVRVRRFREVHPFLVSEAARLMALRIKDPTFLASAGLSASQAFEEFAGILLHGLSRRDAASAPLRQRRRRTRRASASRPSEPPKRSHE
jgi:AcrR family transcriptional regulator